MIDQIKNRIITILFVLVLVTFLILNIIKKDQEISLSERRKLEQFPEFTISKLFDGTFFEKFEKYTMDQFWKREEFRKIKVNTELKVLNKKDYNNLYEYKGYLIEQIYPINEKSILNITNKINQIKEKYLTEDNNIYYSIIPDKNYFVDNGNLKIDYEKLEKEMNENLQFGKYINIFDILKLDDYYKTDSHWKQENLINVAKKIGQEMNIELQQQYEEKTITEFNGVYSGRLAISNEKDKIKVLTNSILENCKVYNYEKEEYTSIYNMDKINSVDKYDIYLSGSVPLISIENPQNENGKELIVFRDSYASSLIPLLIEGYSKITLIDTRYISSQILDKYVEFSNQDILFVYSTLLINNSTTLK